MVILKMITRLKLIALAVLLLLIAALPLTAQQCQAGLPCRQVPWQFPPLPILVSPSPIPTTVATAAPPPTSQSGLVPTPTPMYCPTSIATPGDYRAKVLEISPSGYWPLDETGGTSAGDASGAGMAGTFTGATLNGTTFTGGSAAPTFDGVNDMVTLPAAMLGGALSWTEGTVMLWLKMGAGEWANGTQRVAFVLSKVDGSLIIWKSAANTLTAQMTRGGSTESIDVTISDTGWIFTAVSWNSSGFRFRVNSTVDTANIGGAWGRNLLSARIGSGVGMMYWYGALAHTAVIDRWLSAQDLDALAAADTSAPVGADGCVTAPTAAAPFDIDVLDDMLAAAESAQTPMANLDAAPAYDLYGNSLNFFSILLGLREVDIGPFTPLVIALFAGLFLHISVFVIEKGAPILVVIIGVVRKLIQLVLDFLPG